MTAAELISNCSLSPEDCVFAFNEHFYSGDSFSRFSDFTVVSFFPLGSFSRHLIFLVP